MTMERQDILSDFYAGNSKKIRIMVVDDAGAPKDLTSAKITFAMFEEKSEAIRLIKSSTGLDEIAGSQITIDNPTGGQMTIHLWPKDTYNVVGTFRYHVNVVDGTGFEETVTTGKINLFKSFAKRPHAENLSAYLSGR